MIYDAMEQIVYKNFPIKGPAYLKICSVARKHSLAPDFVHHKLLFLQILIEQTKKKYGRHNTEKYN